MSDLALFVGTGAGVLVFMGIYLAIVSYLERRGECQHDFGAWAFSNTDDAYVQVRMCRKCRYTQIHQTRKIGTKNDGAET